MIPRIPFLLEWIILWKTVVVNNKNNKGVKVWIALLVKNNNVLLPLQVVMEIDLRL